MLDRFYENVRPGGYLLAICELFNAFEHPYRNHFKSRYGVNALDAIKHASQHGVYNGCKGFLGWFHEKRETFSDVMTAGWLWDFDEYTMYAVLMNRVRKMETVE
ncbi:hypothetical protein IW967_02955 [Alicyclobacillus mali]|uniref:Uncharacterized protein n=1 Tax=Alicyclobacillus mali (ex Roth et al. 2021) TaxID=1123961 RepID=A0ABS0F0N6_9BACL|nr:hypothetical protein [Alicyclobacillus mali (ex Roth et al. 2021)]